MDVDARRYIDYVMSWGPLIHGHAPPGLVRVLLAATRRGTSFGAPTELELRLGELVRRRMPAVERIRFVNSGTEAAMSALRVARAATGRDRVIKFEGCYHGHADAFLAQAGSGAMTLGIPTSPGIPRAAVSDMLLAPYNDLAACQRHFATNPGQIAAIIAEPVAGNMGVVLPSDHFLAGLRALCDQHQALLIFDEVITGFRVGPGGAQAIYAVRPDLTCLGKIIGGGLPVGAYGGRADLMALVAPEGPVCQAGTLSGNPLAMAAGLWAVYRLDPAGYRRLARMGRMLAEGLATAARSAGVPLQVNAIGSMLTPFFTTRPVRDYQSAMAASAESYGTFFRGLLARGVYVPPSQYEDWFLSTAHTEPDMATTIRAATAAMKEVAKAAVTL